MVYQWEPGTQYDLGSVVEYEGHQYKIIQPHRSQDDWTPPATPGEAYAKVVFPACYGSTQHIALWGKLPVVSCPSTSPPAYGQQPPSQPPKVQGSSADEDQQPWHEQHSQKVDIPHEEQQKHWWDLDEKRKKELEIGGGLAAGLALLGAGYYAYHSHEKNEEQKKAQVWGLQRWLRDAQTRAAEFHQSGAKGPVTWILVNGKNMPRSAIVGGEENGQPVFIARAFHEGGVHVGKAALHYEQGAIIGYKHKLIQLGAYEVLIGDPRAIRWVDVYGRLSLAGLGHRLVDGGHDETGSPMYVAQANHQGDICPGKTSELLDGAYIPYSCGEVHEVTYKVLAYA